MYKYNQAIKHHVTVTDPTNSEEVGTGCLSQAGGVELARDMSGNATCDMKILSAEWRTGGAPPRQIPSLFLEMKQHLFLPSQAQVYSFNLMLCFCQSAALLIMQILYLLHRFLSKWVYHY